MIYFNKVIINAIPITQFILDRGVLKLLAYMFRDIYAISSFISFKLLTMVLKHLMSYLFDNIKVIINSIPITQNIFDKEFSF